MHVSLALLFYHHFALIDLNFAKLQMFPGLRAGPRVWRSLQLGEEKLIKKKGDDGETVEQFDLPPEEWRWRRDGPADRGGSMLSAAAAQCHVQTDPSSGSWLLYLHATAGETTRAKLKSQRSRLHRWALYSSCWRLKTNFFGPCVHVWRGVLSMNHLDFSVPTACHWCFQELLAPHVTFRYFGSRCVREPKFCSDF